MSQDPQQPQEPQETPKEVVAEELEKLRSETGELQGKLMRAIADYQNYVRRAEQNVVVARQQQTIDMSRALVNVLDHFDNAVAVDPEKVAAAKLLEGVKIVREELLKTLEQFGVRRIEAKAGDEFDPRQHEAMLKQKVEGVGPGCVGMQLQSGYVLGEITLRPAKVTVTE